MVERNCKGNRYSSLAACDVPSVWLDHQTVDAMKYRIRSVYIGTPYRPTVDYALALDLESALRLAKVKAISAQSVQVFGPDGSRSDIK